tara:strand:+ start:2340 stop:5321 length:2982 start_codon:yes stop_codon:yes gene_type:complete
MSEFIEPTGEDIDVATTPSTIFNEPVGEDIFDKNVKPEAKTAGGISLEAVPDSNFFDLLKSIAPSASSTMDFVTNPALSILSAEENSLGNYAEGINTILQNMTLENQRIENVLLEKYGDSYSGENQVGDLSFNERDSLARRSKFEDKFAYFKRKYPEGRLIRTGVGGDKTEILYSLTKDGPLSRVDPNGGFSDFTGDFGDFTGTFANFATAGSIVGSFISPFLGTASLTIVGSMLDRALADEGVDVEDESFRQKLTDSFGTDVAIQGVIEGAINKILPGMGRFFVDRMLGKEGVPAGAFLSKTPPSSLAAQKFAQEEGLPLLTISQLATNSPILQKMAQQVGGTSNLLKEISTTQQKKLYGKAKDLAKQDLTALSQGKLMFSIDKLGKNIISDTIIRIKNIKGTDINVDYKGITDDLALYKNGMNELIDRTYTKAFSSARVDNVRFDISALGNKIDEVLTGTQLKITKKGAKGQNLYEKIGGELQGDLSNLLGQLKRADNDVGTIAVKTFGKKRTFDALKQMLTVRNKLGDIVSQKGDGAYIAKELMDEIDKVIDSPTGGSGDFKKYLADAKLLTKEKSDVINFTSLGTLFDRNAGLNIMKTMDSLYNGNINAGDLSLLKNFMKVSKQGGTKSVQQLDNAQTMTDIQDGFIQYTLSNIDTGAPLLQKMSKEQPELFKLLVPGESTRKALLDFTDKQNWLKNSATVKAMDRELVNAEVAFKEIADSTQAEFIKKINVTGGLNGKYAEQLRLHVLSGILEKGSVTKISDIDGSTIINSRAFVKELDDLKRFAGPYANLKPLFAKAGKPNEIDNSYFDQLEGLRIYGFFANMGEDAGSSFATGSVVGQAVRGEVVEFVRSALPRKFLATLMSQKPSVAQLTKEHGKKSFMDRTGYLNKLSSILTSIERELGLTSEEITPGFEPETRSQEFERTGNPPFMGDKVSSNTITPNTLNLNLPAVSPSGSSGPPTTNYASLFPFDTTGGAIQSRAGIGGLV